MYFDEIKMNMTLETAPVLITKEQILSFGNLYDPLLLHTDEDYAKTAFLFLRTWRKLS